MVAENNSDGLRAELEAALNTLTPRNRDIARAAFGLAKAYKMSVREVAALFKTNEDEIRRILAEVRDMLARRELLHALPRR